MAVDRIGEVGDRIGGWGVWDKFHSRISGKARSQGWDKGGGIKVCSDKKLTEDGRR